MYLLATSPSCPAVYTTAELAAVVPRLGSSVRHLPGRPSGRPGSSTPSAIGQQTDQDSMLSLRALRLRPRRGAKMSAPP